MAEVREHARREAAAVHSALGQRVRRDLQRHHLGAGIGRSAETPAQLRRLGRGVGPVQRADDLARCTTGVRNRSDCVGHRRLARRAGDAHHPAPAPWLAPHSGRGRPERVPHVRHHDLGHVDVEHIGDQQGCRAGRDRLRGEAMAVVVLADHAGEELPRRDRAAVVADAAQQGLVGSGRAAVSGRCSAEPIDSGSQLRCRDRRLGRLRRGVHQHPLHIWRHPKHAPVRRLRDLREDRRSRCTAVLLTHLETPRACAARTPRPPRRPAQPRSRPGTRRARRARPPR